MRNVKLEQKLQAYFDGEKGYVLCESLMRENTSLNEVRDALLDAGTILEEDLGQGIYVARVAGERKADHAPIIAVAPAEERVDVAGIVMRGKERAVREAISIFEKSLEGDLPEPRRRHVLPWLVLALALFMVPAGLYAFPYHVLPAQAATERYNEAVAEFNSVVPSYNDIAGNVSASNIEGLVPEAQKLSMQGTDYFSVCATLLSGNDEGKIEKDAAHVREMAKKLEQDIEVLKAVRNPDAEWVTSCLRRVEGIGQIEAVTPQNDPNMMLGKSGGYTSCVYFTSNLLEASAIAGSTPVQRKNDGGGAVEVYANLDDAQARCDYLSGFDDSILYSGSYALVGTMVIRTSCLLSDDAQYTLTSAIVESMVGET